MMKKVFTIIGFLMITAQIFAANSEVRGVIYDKATNETLPGASIIVTGTNIGTITNIDGEFSLMVPKGLQEIEVRFVGYKVHKQSIQVKENETLKLNIKLEIESVGLKEISVTAMILGQAKAVNQQLSSDAIVNVVSEDKIKELPDANAAEAIGRLPGVALTRSGGEASKVVVRGMEPTFTNVTINGVRMAASDGSDRSADLSMISSEMLAGIEVYKSPTPDMDGESIGGTVNLTARKAKNKPMAKVKVAGIYNDLRSDFGNFQASTVLQKRFFDNKLGVITQFNIEKVNRGTDNVSNTWDLSQSINGETTPVPEPAKMNSTFEDRRRYGGSINLDYKLENGGIYYSGIYNRTTRDVHTNNRSLSRSSAISLYKFTSQDYIKDLMSNSLSGKHNIIGTKLDWMISTSSSNSMQNNDLSVEFEQKTSMDSAYVADNGVPTTTKEMLSILVDDPDVVGLVDGIFKPDSTFERNTTVKIDWEIPFNLGDNISGSIKTGGKYRVIDRWHREHQWKSNRYYLEEDAMSDLENSLGRDLDRNELNEISMSNFTQDNYEQEEFMQGEYNFYYPLDPEKVEEIYKKDKDNWKYYAGQSKQDEYYVNEHLTAGYLMAKLKLFKDLTIIPGVRLEYSDNDYTAYATESGGTEADQASNADKRTSNMKYLVVLPHFHLKYKPVRWFDTRLVINQTVGRPKYNQVLPRERLNPTGSPSSITAGNSNLNPTLSTNYDFSVSFYKGSIGLLSAGVFYKDIKDHIYKRNKMILATDAIAEAMNYSGYTDWALTTYHNVDAKAYGFEVEVQTVLKFLPEPLNGIVLSANYSHQQTQSTYQGTRDTVLYTFNPDNPTQPITEKSYVEEFREASMINQSPNTFNASIGWDFKGFSARFSGIFQDTKMSVISTNSPTKDQFTLKSWQWDASMSYTFLKKYKVFALLNNFSNRHDYEYKFDEQYFTKDKQYGLSMIYGIQVKL